MTTVPLCKQVMSTNFSSNQYEGAYKPHRLQNYEIPRQHKQHPSHRRGHTQFIANDKGHIISEKWRSSMSPWGHFVGTWQAPRKPIKLQVKTKFMSQQMRESSRPATAPAGSIARLEEEHRSPSVTIQLPQEEERKESPIITEKRATPDGSKKNETSNKQSLPVSPGESGARNGSAVISDRPSAPTPSYATGSSRKSQRLSASATPNKRSAASSRMLSAPPSRQHSSLGKGGGHSPAATPQPIESVITGSSTMGTSPDRPHSRQVSQEGSGIGTSHGLKVYTPLTTAGKAGGGLATRSSTAAESRASEASTAGGTQSPPNI